MGQPLSTQSVLEVPDTLLEEEDDDGVPLPEPKTDAVVPSNDDSFQTSSHIDNVQQRNSEPDKESSSMALAIPIPDATPANPVQSDEGSKEHLPQETLSNKSAAAAATVSELVTPVATERCESTAKAVVGESFVVLGEEPLAVTGDWLDECPRRRKRGTCENN